MPDDAKACTLTLQDIAKAQKRGEPLRRKLRRILGRRNPLFKSAQWVSASPVVDVPGEVTVQPKDRFLRVKFEFVGPKPRGKVRAYLEAGGKEARMK